MTKSKTQLPQSTKNKSKSFAEGYVDALTFGANGYGPDPGRLSEKSYLSGWECGLGNVFEVRITSLLGEICNE